MCTSPKFPDPKDKGYPLFAAQFLNVSAMSEIGTVKICGRTGKYGNIEFGLFLPTVILEGNIVVKWVNISKNNRNTISQVRSPTHSVITIAGPDPTCG